VSTDGSADLSNLETYRDIILIGSLIAWSGAFIVATLLTLHDRDRKARRRRELAELQLLWEDVLALNQEVVALAISRGIQVTDAPTRPIYREWWELDDSLSPGRS
jgi:hypothetical protein